MPRAPATGSSAELATIVGALAAAGDPVSDLVSQYLETIIGLAAARRPASQVEIDTFRGLGGRAAGRAIPVAHLVRLLSAGTGALWPKLPDLLATRGRYPASRGEALELGGLVWDTANAAISAVIAGHEEVQRTALLRDRELDQMFLSDLLAGTADVADLVELAEQVGFAPAVPHFATVLAVDRGCTEPDRLLRALETALRIRPGRGDVLAGEYRGDIVIVMSAAPDAQEQIGKALTAVHEADGSPLGGRWWAGIGRAWQGLRGVSLSYYDAREALQLARQFGSDERIVPPARLLLYRVLVPDQRAMADLVRSVLGPLCGAHQGAGPLLDTLDEFFAAGGVLTEAARNLHLTVRAVSYRLDRIRLLTGHDVAVPMDRLTLQLAVMGARLLGWPDQPLTELD
jgi:sugar diacid utilization regulator